MLTSVGKQEVNRAPRCGLLNQVDAIKTVCIKNTVSKAEPELA